MRIPFIWGAALSLLCAACTPDPAREAQVRSVYVTRPAALTSGRVLTYPGVVQAAHDVSLGFKTAGQLTHVYVREGDAVRPGQLLATLDDADYRLGVEALEVQYGQLEDEVSRLRRLFAQKSVSANDFEKAEAGLKQLGVQLQASRNKLAYTRLYAPTAGRVQAVNFAPAEMVDAGTPVFTLLDESRMEVVADVPADVFRRGGHPDGYGVRFGADGDEVPLTFYSLTPKADGNQLCQLRLALPARTGARPVPGTNVEVVVHVADTAAVTGYALPLSAVFEAGGQACVWVLRSDSTLVRRTVRLAPEADGGQAVVVAGLAGSERVVRAGAATLKEGEKVRVLAPPAATNVGGLL